MGYSAAQLIQDGLNPRLDIIQKLQVWDEAGRIRPNSLVEFAYDDWISTITPEVTLNRDIVTSGYTVDSVNGKITFTSPSVAVEQGDEVLCSYTFRWFTDDMLTDFLNLSLSEFNNRRPVSSYILETMPADWLYGVVDGAYKLALETMLLDLTTWKARLVFTDPSAAASYAQNLIAGIEARWSRWRKGRLALTPRSISSGRWRMSAVADSHNWQQYTIVRA